VPGRISQLADLIKDQRADMLCFQETIKQDFLPIELQKLTGGLSFHWHMVPTRGHSGGLLMGVREEDFDCLARDQGSFLPHGDPTEKYWPYLGIDKCLWPSSTLVFF
jgi:hypothetical protein